MTTGFIYVNIDLRHQYGISVAESQTFLLAKLPSAAISEEKRQPFAGYMYISRYQEFLSIQSAQTEWKECEMNATASRWVKKVLAWIRKKNH